MKNIDRDILAKSKGYSGFNEREELGCKTIDTNIYFSAYETNIDNGEMDAYNAIITRHDNGVAPNLNNTLWIRLDDIQVDMNDKKDDDYTPHPLRDPDLMNTLRTADVIETSGTDVEKAGVYGLRNLRFSKQIFISNPSVHLYRYENGVLEAVMYCMYDNKINFSLFKKCLGALPAIFVENNISTIDRVFIPAICKNYQKLNDKDTVVFAGVATEIYGMFANAKDKKGIFSSGTLTSIPKRIDVVNIFKEKKEVPKPAPKKKVVMNDSFKKPFNKNGNGPRKSYNGGNNKYDNKDRKPYRSQGQSSSNGGYSKPYKKPYNPNGGNRYNNGSYNKYDNRGGNKY